MKLEESDDGTFEVNPYREDDIEALAVKIGEYGSEIGKNPMDVAYDFFDQHIRQMDSETQELADNIIKSFMTAEFKRIVQGKTRDYKMGDIYFLMDVKDMRQKFESELQDKLVEVTNS